MKSPGYRPTSFNYLIQSWFRAEKPICGREDLMGRASGAHSSSTPSDDRPPAVDPVSRLDEPAMCNRELFRCRVGFSLATDILLSARSLEGAAEGSREPRRPRRWGGKGPWSEDLRVRNLFILATLGCTI